MFRCIVTAGLAFALALPEALAAEATDKIGVTATEEIVVQGLKPKRPPKIRYVPPRVPIVAGQIAKEGWVHLQLSLSETGKVIDVVVHESYPNGMFTPYVLEVAKGWQFEPKRKDGVAVPNPEFHVSVSFYADIYEKGYLVPEFRRAAVRGVDASNLMRFQKVVNALDAGDLKAAESGLETLRQRMDKGHMTVTDIARYFAMRTKFNRMSAHYDTALDYARRALMLAEFLDNGKTVYGIHLEVLSSLTALERNDEAVDYFDSWRDVTRSEIPADVVQFFENLRGRGAGKGKVYEVVDFDRATRREYARLGGGTSSAEGSFSGGTMSMNTGTEGTFAIAGSAGNINYDNPNPAQMIADLTTCCGALIPGDPSPY